MRLCSSHAEPSVIEMPKPSIVWKRLLSSTVIVRGDVPLACVKERVGCASRALERSDVDRYELTVCENNGRDAASRRAEEWRSARESTVFPRGNRDKKTGHIALGDSPAGALRLEVNLCGELDNAWATGTSG